MKVLIFGNGWIASRLLEVFSDARIVSLFSELENHIKDYDCIINTAAKTHIDWCENNKVETLHSNVDLAHDVAALTYERGKRHVFLSSVCIFESEDINDIKDEYSVPNPKCFYALSKWVAEEIIKEVNPFSVIIRLRLPLSEKPHPRNTITKLLSYPYLNTNYETVTVIEDFLPVFKRLVEGDSVGTFHLVNEGTISPAEIGDALGHMFIKTSKAEQDERLKWEGRAKRVTTIAISYRIPLLPNIRERLPEIVANYNENLAHRK